jgi:hypothetical protein
MICPRQWEGNITFPAVDANLITDRLTIRISSIDGIPAEDAARQKRISVMPEAEYRQSINPRWISRPTAFNAAFFTVDREGKLTGYSGTGSDVVIPVTVTKIGGVFNNVRKSGYFNQLTSVTIPNSVRTIGDREFYKNQLTSVIIPDSVRTIGVSAFSFNQLTSVTIPDSVRTIGRGAFINNRLTSITIGADVTIEIPNSRIEEAFNNNFRSFYDNNGKKAGVYTYRRNNWSYSPQ